jgi:hypothetical protein
MGANNPSTNIVVVFFFPSFLLKTLLSCHEGKLSLKLRVRFRTPETRQSNWRQQWSY